MLWAHLKANWKRITRFSLFPSMSVIVIMFSITTDNEIHPLTMVIYTLMMIGVVASSSEASYMSGKQAGVNEVTEKLREVTDVGDA